MVGTPTSKQLRMKWWDLLRNRYNITYGPTASKKDLMQTVRAKLGLEKGERAKGSAKSTTAFLRKSDFWKASKRDYGGKYSDWRRWEERDLKELSKSYKGKELVERYNKMTDSKRSYMSVMVKLSRVKKVK